MLMSTLDWKSIIWWARANQIKHFPLSSGGRGKVGGAVAGSNLTVDPQFESSHGQLLFTVKCTYWKDADKEDGNGPKNSDIEI